MRYLALALLLAGQALSIPTISTKGSKLFTSDGNQFFIKGIAYQLTENDPLIDGNQCKLDAALMKTIGANSIRVYHVDAAANHDSCMQTFADAGIYAWIDLDTFSTYVLPPAGTVPRWNQTQYQAYSKVMDTFHNYDNVAGFFVGNEDLTTPETSIAAPFVKAAARDMKAYRDSKGYRKFPIGYTAADVAALRPMLQNYLACGANSSEAVDFYGLNAYEWCGQSSYDVSGYQFLQQNASDYNVPIFFSETGCNTPSPRTFDDQAAIFGSQMRDTWSGAIIYEWIQEANNYGLVSYGSSASGSSPTNSAVVDGITRAGTPTPVQPDFSNLSKQWATLSPSGVKASAYSPSLTPPPCPAFTSGAWSVNPSAAIPTLGQAYNSANVVQASSAGPASASGSGAAAASPSASASAGKTGAATLLTIPSTWALVAVLASTVALGLL